MGAMRAKNGSVHETSAAVLLAHALGHAFYDPSLLRLALTHRSFVYESTICETNPQPAGATNARHREGRNAPGTDNEQLEFLGDSVLGLVVTELLYAEFPERSEGELTRMRASLVSRDRLAALGAELGLAEHLLLGESAEHNGARKQPGVLADATEAVLAAVYLDAMRAGNEGLAAVRGLVRDRLLAPALEDLRAAMSSDPNRGALRDFKTLLQERVQASNAGRLLYVDVAHEGPPHQRRFTVEARLQAAEGGEVVLATAEGGSKKEAQQRAAQGALANWPPDLNLAFNALGTLAPAEASR